VRIKGLLVPARLVRLVESGRWRGCLSAETLARIAPGMDARIELCASFGDMLRAEPPAVEQFHFYRGSQQPAPCSSRG
jgi:hypothetical protein